MTSARLLIDPPARGSWNMAMDQALLEATDARREITLRFYRWSEPTLSLGYFQKESDRQLNGPSSGCSLVRRTSGGGAIVHDHELTYSICVPESNRWSKASTELYDLVHGQFVELLAEIGVSADLVSDSGHSSEANQSFLCFQRRTDGDVVVAGAKILGSAQRRLRNALIQHGSLLLKRSEFAPKLEGLEELTGKEPDVDYVCEQLANRVGKKLGVDFVHSEATKNELAEADRIERERFLDENWNKKR